MAPPPLLSDREAEDLAAVAVGDRLWVAWTRARLGGESVWGARWDAGAAAWSEPVELTPGTKRAFRPAIAALAGGEVLVAACGPDGVHGATFRSDDEAPSTWRIQVGSGLTTVALAADGERAWLACERRRGASSSIAVGRIDASGAHESKLALEFDGRCREAPALSVGPSGTWLAWVEGLPRGAGTLHVARIEGDELGEALAIDDGVASHGAPVLYDAGDRLYAAWHGPVPAHPDADVLRWLRVVAIDPATRSVTAMHPEPGPLERDDAGFDQGWEFPALIADDGGLWLAGRSSHGFHVAHRDGEAWSVRTSLSSDEWGGRGRRTALVRHGGDILYVRREPDGLVATPIESMARRPAKPRGYVATPLVGASRVKARGVLFGDLHQHTALSDGCGMPEDLYVRGRDLRGLDFAAVTDHDRFCRRAIGPATWSYMRHVADAFNEPGRFVTFPAYEFTGPRLPGPGHKCIYFGDGGPDRVPDKDVDAVFAAARAHDGIAVPHHVGWTGADIEHHDPVIQPVWEIVSVHGCYECCGAPTAFPPRDDVVLPDQFVKNALDAGLRFGFIGSTDSHGLLWHHGIARKRDPFASGLAAVLTSDLDRGAILAALRARRCYATTGARILLRADLDGAPIGSDLPPGTGGKLAYEIVGTAAIQSAFAVSAGGERELPGIDGARCSGSIDIAPSIERDNDYLFLRVVQCDGETAWSSPWFW